MVHTVSNVDYSHKECIRFLKKWRRDMDKNNNSWNFTYYKRAIFQSIMAETPLL